MIWEIAPLLKVLMYGCKNFCEIQNGDLLPVVSQKHYCTALCAHTVNAQYALHSANKQHQKNTYGIMATVAIVACMVMLMLCLGTLGRSQKSN